MEDKKFCSHCGEEMKKEANYCNSCGKPVKIDKELDTESEEIKKDAIPESNDSEFNDLSKKISSKTSEMANETKNKADEIADKLTKKTGKKFKGTYLIVAAIAIIIIGSFGTYKVMSNQKTSIIGDVEISYNGYNGIGEATIKGDYATKEQAAIAKKVGYSSSDVQAVKEGNYSVLTADETKLAQYTKYINDTKVSLNKSTKLSNGEKLTLKVTTSLKDNPIKSQEKSVKVNQLKKSTKIDWDGLKNDSPISFKGFNHFGKIDYNSDVYSINDESTDGLSNDDKVNLIINDNYISKLASKGIIYSGKTSETVTVSGLEDSPKINNQSELLSQIDSLAKSENKSSDYTTYTVTRQESYFIGKNVKGYYSSDDDDAGDTFSIISIYKIDQKSTYGDPSTTYEIYGYQNLKDISGKVNIQSLTDNDQINNLYYSDSSKEDVLNSLKKDYPSLVKIN